jgi:hypothetical protein
MKIKTDIEGRRYSERADGSRVYMPKPAVTEAEKAAVRRGAKRVAEAMEQYHRVFKSSI